MIKLLLASVVTLLIGCVDYQKIDFLQTSANTFRVTFEGNTLTSKTEVDDYALWDSAEVCIEHGFRYFVIMNGINHVQQDIQRWRDGSVTVREEYTKTNEIMAFSQEPNIAGKIVYDAWFVLSSMSRKYN